MTRLLAGVALKVGSVVAALVVPGLAVCAFAAWLACGPPEPRQRCAPAPEGGAAEDDAAAPAEELEQRCHASAYWYAPALPPELEARGGERRPRRGRGRAGRERWPELAPAQRMNHGPRPRESGGLLAFLARAGARRG
jgi:hypothetical protein